MLGFKTKNTRISISKLYINSHTMERFRDRQTKEINFHLPKEIRIIVMPQRFKENKEVEINSLRAVVPLRNNLYLIGIIFEKNNILYLKALTILKEKQIRTGSNFARGNYLTRGFLSDRPKIVVEDKNFDDSYKDYLTENIEWSEYDVDYI